MSKTRKNNLTIDKKLFNSSYDQLTELSSLKTNSYLDFQKNIKKAYRHPITKHILKSKLTPKSYSELRESKQNLFSNNLEGELAWIIESLKYNSSIINEFITYEKRIEQKILLGRFDEGYEELKIVNSKICYSYWGLELEYFFTEILEGTEGNWHLKNSINKNCKNSFSIFFNQIFSKRAEKNISILDFSRSFSNDIRNVPQLELEYLNFKLAYPLLQDYNNLSFICYGDNISSIIDRYLSIINILTELISSSEEKNIDLVKNVLNDLENIHDDRLLRIKEYIGINNLSINDHKVFLILENYTCGNYQYCLENIPKAIEGQTSNIELWDLYLKSLIESNTPFKKLGFSKFIDNLLFELYRVYLVEDDSKEKAENILKLVSTIPNIPFAKQLTALIVDRIGLISIKNVFNNAYCINSKISNPLIILHSKNAKMTAEFEALKTSICINYISGKEINEENLIGKIKDFKFKLYKLRRAFGANDYSECIEIYKKSEYKDLKNNLYIEEIIFIIYHSLFHLKKHDEAIDLYIDCYFNNKNLLNRINSRILIDKIISEDYTMCGSLNSAIFFTLENLDTYYHFVGIEMWLDSIGIELPSEVELNNTQSNFDKILFLLENGCSIEVLEKFYNIFDNKDEVIEERKKILSTLIQKKPNESERFIDELSSITQREKIQSLLKEVNSGRIRLDSEMISSDTVNNFEKSFNRYQLLSEFSKTNEISSFDSKKLLRNFLESLLENQSPSINPSFLSFKNLVNEMIDSFLFNKKSGLDGELSTRIRHGELENQLRSVFDRNNLISKRDDSNKYTDVKLWNSHYEDILSESSLKSIQNALKSFSTRIDKIIQFLVQEEIQVHSENYPLKPNAYFNYHFSESYLRLLYEESSASVENFEQFKEYIFSILTVYTESHLNKISDYLTNTLRKRIDNQLDSLKTELDSISTERPLAELSQNIIDAKVDLQNEVYGISDWFIISDSTIDKHMDVKTLIECSFESSNIQHPNTPINPEIIASNNIIFYHYKHFIFIFLNLIDNIRIHSKLQNDDLNVSVSVEKVESDFHIKVRNNFNDLLVDKTLLETKLNEIKENWNEEIDYKRVNKEGGTGFEKIKKILAYDIKLKDHEFDFVIDNNSLEVIFKINVIPL